MLSLADPPTLFNRIPLVKQTMANQAVIAGQVLLAVSGFLSLCATHVDDDSACQQTISQCSASFYSAQTYGVSSITATMAHCSTFPAISRCLEAAGGGADCQSRAAQVRDNLRFLLVESGLCDRQKDAKAHEACFARPELQNACETAQSREKNLCRSLEGRVACWTRRTNDVCGSAAADFVQFFMKIMSRNIAGVLRRSCSGLQLASSAESVHGDSSSGKAALSRWAGIILLVKGVLIGC